MMQEEMRTLDDAQLAADQELLERALVWARQIMPTVEKPYHYQSQDLVSAFGYGWMLEGTRLYFFKGLVSTQHYILDGISSRPLVEVLSKDRRAAITRFVECGAEIKKEFDAIGDKRTHKALAKRLKREGATTVTSVEPANSDRVFISAINGLQQLNPADRSKELQKMSPAATTPEQHHALGMAHLDLAKELAKSSTNHAGLAARHLRRAANIDDPDHRHQARYGLFLACVIGRAYESAERALLNNPVDNLRLTGEHAAVIAMFEQLSPRTPSAPELGD